MTLRRLAVATAVFVLAALIAPTPTSAQDGDGTTTVYLAGDSTVSYYPEAYYPMEGWGQRLGDYLDESVVVDNRAVGARSSKSFVLEGRLDAILADIQPGDYLLVQFGHNDRSNTDSLCPANPAYCNRHTDPYTSFKEYLQYYIDGARAHGATPVLVTPMGRRNFNDDGSFNNDFYDYSEAMKQLSAEHSVPLVDLNAASIAFYTRIGPPATEEVFLYTDPLEYERYPDGKSDNVHFQHYGADWLARFVAEGLAGLELPVSERVVLPETSSNLAFGAEVSASSSIESDWWYRWNVADGERTPVDQALGWASDDVFSAVDQTEWVQLDLGQTLPLTRTVLYPNSAGFPVDFTVEVSADGEVWTQVASETGHADRTEPLEVTFEPAEGRYVRVTSSKLQLDGAAYRMRLAEVEVYSDVVSVQLTGPGTLTGGGRGVYTAELRVPATAEPPTAVKYDLEVPDGWQTKRYERSDGVMSWMVTAPSVGWAEPAQLRANVVFRQAGEQHAIDSTLTVAWDAPPPPPEPGQYWVSDLEFLEAANGWGPVERDMSNGEKEPGDGRPITVDGTVYDKGLGVHADAAVTIALDGCETFTAVVGLDDEVGGGGSVAFLVEGDGAPLWVHPLSQGGDAGVPVSVDVTGVSELRLVVSGLGSNGHDHADWAAARVSGCAV